MLPSGQPVTEPPGRNVELTEDWSDLCDPLTAAAWRASVAVPRSAPDARGFLRLPLAEAPRENRWLPRDSVAVTPSDPGEGEVR